MTDSDEIDVDAVYDLNDEIQDWLIKHPREIPDGLARLLALLDFLLNGK